MELARRIARLESVNRITECPICHGQPPWVTTAILEGEEPPPVEGCPGCGEARQALLVWCNESMPGQPKVESCQGLTADEICRLHGDWRE